MNYKILFLVFTLFFISNVSANIEIAYVTNDTYVDEAQPGTNLNSNTANLKRVLLYPFYTYNTL